MCICVYITFGFLYRRLWSLRVLQSIFSFSEQWFQMMYLESVGHRYLFGPPPQNRLWTWSSRVPYSRLSHGYHTSATVVPSVLPNPLLFLFTESFYASYCLPNVLIYISFPQIYIYIINSQSHYTHRMWMGERYILICQGWEWWKGTHFLSGVVIFLFKENL